MLIQKKNAVYESENPLTLQEHMEILHASVDGYAVVAYRNGQNQFSQRYGSSVEKIVAIIMELGREADVWVSQNSFYLPSRKTENVRQLRCLYIDLDCHKLGITPHQALLRLEQEYFRQNVPEPNLITFSGEGLQLIWRIIPEGKYGLEPWRKAQALLRSKLAALGADPAAIDASRVLRVSQTIHLETGRTVATYFRHPYIFSLTEVLNEYLIEGKVNPEEKREKPSIGGKKVAQIFTRQSNPFFNLAGDRREDLKKLVYLRADLYPKEGTHNGLHGREVLLFLFRYYSLFHCNPDEAYQECVELNRKFKFPLPESELESATTSAETAYAAYVEAQNTPEGEKPSGQHLSGYCYTTKRLVELLQIQPDEQVQMKNLIGKEEKNRRRRERRREKGAQPAKGKSDHAGIVKLHAEEPLLSQSEIARRLKVSQSQVSRVLGRINT